MSYIVVIRESKYNDTPAINEIVRNAYISNVPGAWCNALLKEITFQLIVISAAVMFIFLGVPLLYCVAAVPIVFVAIYVVIYGSFVMKAIEVCSSKTALQSWVAEVYVPYFFSRNPQDFNYKIVPESKLLEEDMDMSNYQRKIVGTVSVNNHLHSNKSAWLYKLAVEKGYRSKGIGRALVQAVQNHCRRKGYLDLHSAVSECQESARQLLNNCGFQMRLMYHKMLIGSALTLLMYQLECDLKPDL